jgi:hypothetical protein
MKNHENKEFFEALKGLVNAGRAAQQAVDNLAATEDTAAVGGHLDYKSVKLYLNPDTIKLLEIISPSLAESYKQVAGDLASSTRKSWMGTAHEIREILRGVLHIMAPNKDVTGQVWYEQLPGTHGPTQKQMVKYILQVKKDGSGSKKLLSDIGVIDDKIEDIARDTYSRASDAAHRSKDKNEVFKLLKYFDAFVYDLLN